LKSCLRRLKGVSAAVIWSRSSKYCQYMAPQAGPGRGARGRGAVLHRAARGERPPDRPHRVPVERRPQPRRRRRPRRVLRAPPRARAGVNGGPVCARVTTPEPRRRPSPRAPSPRSGWPRVARGRGSSPRRSCRPPRCRSGARRTSRSR